jgi:hypothetical protein
MKGFFSQATKLELDFGWCRFRSSAKTELSPGDRAMTLRLFLSGKRVATTQASGLHPAALKTESRLQIEAESFFLSSSYQEENISQKPLIFIHVFVYSLNKYLFYG